ncbi:MAG: hypothetical protein LUB59_01640 [Candidatus Gastranaerophilales bacterium]|nr:hypothetical protein [Candidatus Gastranaerophilales bacterium]
MADIVSKFGNNNQYLLRHKQLTQKNLRDETCEQSGQSSGVQEAQEVKKQEPKQRRKDIYAQMPIRALGYSNELGEAIRPLSPLLANLSWLPAIAYISADVSDKYRQDEYGNQEPSSKRASKQLLTQLLASVLMPTAAVKLGQGVANNTAAFSKKGLTLRHREKISDMVLNSMNAGDHKAFLDAGGKINKALYKESLGGKVDEIVKHRKTHTKLLEPFYAAVDFIQKPFIKAPKIEKIKDYAGTVVDRLVDSRQQLLDGVKPEKMSKKAFKKFLNVSRGVPLEEKQSMAFDAIRKMEKSRMFNNRTLKSIGGLAALSLLAKPIDNFVEHVVIGKCVGPAIDKVGGSSKNTRETKDTKRA